MNMLNFKDYLVETGDASYETTLKRIFGSYCYEFETKDGRPGGVTISAFHFDDEYTWLVRFSIDGLLSITNRGDAFAIMATVIKAMEDWYKREKPKHRVMFAASREGKNPESRIKLYRRLVRKFAQKYNYQFVEKEKGRDIIFILNPAESEHA